ncbi:AfsR/SARP family transcriptional regulator [Actinoplanes palleronii]|uniref:OmpR/PhoB-type domain-containing protein n=1 Tax=Actinoplanes palleronii TaxID=113570 RepID=A0ABQ4BQE7_9ACTN|nr:BTAD domain-containing putative transcriptional regulator [Actinoplanes palleronii]GIE72900.1 hypothetical protein Apa02nite_090080 [Actinoplanes palleronii]
MTDNSATQALRFEILGQVRAYRNDEPVDIGSLNQRAVLAVLLLHARSPVPINKIIHTLWDDDPPENAVDIVQRYVGGLRRALDPDRTSLLALTPDGYMLSAGTSAVDASVFRASLARARDAHQTGNLQEATGEVHQAFRLWQDEPLAGLTGPVFESARARLNQERTAAANLLATPAPEEPTMLAPPVAVEPTVFTAAVPAEPVAAKPAPVPAPSGYQEPVDPWAGHDLFPPSPF